MPEPIDVMSEIKIEGVPGTFRVTKIETTGRGPSAMDGKIDIVRVREPIKWTNDRPITVNAGEVLTVTYYPRKNSMIDVSKIKPGDQVKVKVDPGYNVQPYSIEGEAYMSSGYLYVGPVVVRTSRGLESGRTILEHTPKWSPPEGWRDWDGVAVEVLGETVIIQRTDQGSDWPWFDPLARESFTNEALVKRYADHDWRQVTIGDPESITCSGCGRTVIEEVCCDACQRMSQAINERS